MYLWREGVHLWMEEIGLHQEFCIWEYASGSGRGGADPLDIKGYGQQAVSMHPTAMLSCYSVCIISLKAKFRDNRN